MFFYTDPWLASYLKPSMPERYCKDPVFQAYFDDKFCHCSFWKKYVPAVSSSTSVDKKKQSLNGQPVKCILRLDLHIQQNEVVKCRDKRIECTNSVCRWKVTFLNDSICESYPAVRLLA